MLEVAMRSKVSAPSNQWQLTLRRAPFQTFLENSNPPKGKTPNMKTYRTLRLVAVALLLVGATRAADETRTITGEAMCAKCELKLQDECQTVIQVKEGNQLVNYYLATDDAARAFHPRICKGPAPTTATGTVAIVDGKHVLTVTSIQVMK
jgi:hypothetical protein